ncbi:MAG: cytochrome b/b6 domain-containing protein [Glaciecola sp.]
MRQGIKVWDVPTRLFHWLLVAAIVFQYVSAEIVDNLIQWHFYVGYSCIGLVLFRLLWGMVGSHYAKFSQFMVSPTTAIKYVKGQSSRPFIGHNPIGGYSVVLLLSLVLTQALTGLFITDDIFSSGPYYGVLPAYWEDLANFVHHNGFNVLLAAIALHVSAIIFYRIKAKQNLTKAMITGTKDLTDDELSHLPSEDSEDKQAPIQVRTNWWLFLSCLLIAVLAVYLLVEVFAPEPVDDYFGY